MKSKGNLGTSFGLDTICKQGRELKYFSYFYSSQGTSVWLSVFFFLCMFLSLLNIILFFVVICHLFLRLFSETVVNSVALLHWVLQATLVTLAKPLC